MCCFCKAPVPYYLELMTNRVCVSPTEMSIDSDRDSVAESEEGKDRDVSLIGFFLPSMSRSMH